MGSMGALLGELMGDDDDEMGDDDDELGELGATVRKLATLRRRRGLALPPKPRWRKRQIAPGVQGPSQGLEPLPLVPDTNGGLFTDTVTSMTYRGRPQRPFRAERLVATIAKTGTSAAGLTIVSSGIFVGTDLQQLQIGNYDLAQFSPTAFDMRMVLQPAEPGIDIAIGALLAGGALTTGDTIFCSLLLLGRSIQ